MTDVPPVKVPLHAEFASGVRDIIETAKDATAPHHVEAGKHYIVHGERGPEHIDLTGDEYRDLPRRKSGTVVVDTVASFAHYFGKHADGESEVFASVDDSTVTAVLDAHGESRARWQGHRLVLELRNTPSWTRWLARDRQMLSQQSFAEHIEECIDDIRSVDGSPSGLDMLEIAQTFKATVGAKFDSRVNLHSGEYGFAYTEEINAGTARHELKVPKQFVVGLQPFEDSEGFAVVARFRYRTDRSNGLMLGYLLTRPEGVLRDAVLDVIGQVEEQTGADVMRGQPA